MEKCSVIFFPRYLLSELEGQSEKKNCAKQGVPKVDQYSEKLIFVATFVPVCISLQQILQGQG